MAYLYRAICPIYFVLIAGLVAGSSCSMASSTASSRYLIGMGNYDITGPAADANMMGYANPTQNAAGIHIRLRARTFIVAEKSSMNDSIQNRIVFVNLDACMASQAVTMKVLQRLKSRYGDMYTEKNVAISGTHTHSGPGGYLQYVLYIITSMGFIRQSFDAIVDGIENSIIQAHDNLRPGSIFVNNVSQIGGQLNIVTGNGRNGLFGSQNAFRRGDGDRSEEGYGTSSVSLV
ncbi:hypothetical protein L7F22_021620 [Adiantum nelumboides]|nr:hypothetical protein [Adiantum nelumboides]